MAFVLPNGTVVDLDRMDRDAILAATADRRRLAQQDRNSARTAQIQGQALSAEAQTAAAEREQTGRLAEAEMSQRERMAGAAERALDGRLETERKANRELFTQEQLRMVDAEESQADGVAKRLNDLTAEWDSMKPDPKKDPDKYLEWQRGRGRIRQQVPINFEGALIEENGVWKVDPSHFKIKRSRWMSDMPSTPGGPATGVAGIAAALSRSAGASPAAPAATTPTPAVAPVMPQGTPASVDQPMGIADALRQRAPMPGFIPGYGMPSGGPPMSAPQPPSLDIGRALQMLAQIFGSAGGVSPGGQPFNLPRNNPLPMIGKYQTFGVQ